MTLESFFAVSPDLVAVADEAARLGFQIGLMLGAGGYGAVFEVINTRCTDEGLPSWGWGSGVLKIAGVEFAGTQHIHNGECGPYRDAFQNAVFRIGGPSLTGPLLPSAPATLREASSLLRAACLRQQGHRANCPLARLHGMLPLTGRPAALFERLRGRNLRSLMAESPGAGMAKIPAVARSLMRLHDSFGGHGDLKPDHVFIHEGRVVFIDPLPTKGGLIGSVGYASPFMLGADPRLMDLGGLAAILAELWGGTMGWDVQSLYCPANQHNGRFACRPDYGAEVLKRMHDGTTRVPPVLRSWILEVGSGNIRDGAGRYFREWTSSELRQACRDRLMSLVEILEGK